ncbi:MAG: alpha/beta fold hydrolase, partial [Candidatus Kariarchaeaceae archaeon]
MIHMIDGYVSVNDQEIYYHDYPREDTETIIFLHYGTGNLSMWNAMLSSFIDDFRVITCDLRGHGCSSKPIRGYHIDDFADDVNLLMERLSIIKAYIVGSSLGMDTAVSLAARYP